MDVSFTPTATSSRAPRLLLCLRVVAAAGTQPLALERNEVIALVNLLAKLSDSVETVRALNVVLDQQAQQKQQQQGQAAGSSGKA